MKTYWLTFRLADNDSYERRYKALYGAVELLATKWWLEASSFIVFASDASLDAIVDDVEAAIDPSVDLVLIGMPEFKSGRLIGHLDDHDIFELMPFVKKV